MLQRVSGSDSLGGIHVQTRLDQVLQVSIAFTPIYIAERDRPGAILVVLNGCWLVRGCEFIEDDSEAEHVDGLVDEALAKLWGHVPKRADSLHRQLAIAFELAAEPEVAHFGDIVLLLDIG